MRLCALISLIALPISLAALRPYSKAALDDEVALLPGAPPTNFRTFSGYINVGGTKEIFYIFVESQGNVEKDPLLLWTNGGPGCSGLGGLFTELGPFVPTAGGKLDLNPYSWNRLASIVFIEQPAGVGFSYLNETTTYGDDQAATDNYKFILGFKERFSNLDSNDFYISSESYGGHYIPTLAKKIVVNGGVKNFKGAILGNPVTWEVYRNLGQYKTFSGHQYIPKPLWDSFLDNQCDKVTVPYYSGACSTITRQMDSLAAGFDPYALDFPVCISNSRAGRNERHSLLSFLSRSATMRQAEAESLKSGGLRRPAVETSRRLDNYFPTNYEPCEEDYATTYLNRQDVQDALHISPLSLLGKKGWSDCSNTVGRAYSQADGDAPMMEYWEFLTSGGYGLDLLIYSGDDDSVCPTAGTQEFIWDQGWDIVTPWAAWKSSDKQVGGFYVKFSNPRDPLKSGILRFATVHGAGHMVPSTRPAQGFELVQNFLNKKLP